MSEKRNGDVVTNLKYKKNEVVIYFQSGNKVALSPETFTDFHIYSGKEVDNDELSNILHASSEDRYYVYCLKLFGKDLYSEKEIQTKLFSKGADEGIVISVTKKLKDLGLINDEAYANTFVHDIAQLRLYGKNKILYELRSKGISSNIVNSIELGYEEEKEKAFRYASILNRKYVKSPSEKKALQMIRSLIERGFDEKVAEEAVEACISPMDEESEKKLLDRYFELAKSKYSRKYVGYQLKEKIYLDLRKKGFHSKAIKETIEKGIEL